MILGHDVSVCFHGMVSGHPVSDGCHVKMSLYVMRGVFQCKMSGLHVNVCLALCQGCYYEIISENDARAAC